MAEIFTESPKISVIVPCYNVEAYIDRALGSLQAQSFADFEIIAVDDGSNDRTADRLQRWLDAEPRLRILRQENKGPHQARLSGIAQARGEWVTFMDADDELLPSHLAGLWAGIEDEVDVVVTGISAVALDGSMQLYGPREGDMTGAQAAAELLVGHHSNGLFSCWNKLYRRRALSESRLEWLRINYGEDQIFNLRVFCSIRGRVRGVGGHSYRYIARQGSLMHSVSYRHVGDFFELWRERDEVALSLLNSKLMRTYKWRKMLALMDFSGTVFRSNNQLLMQRLKEGMSQMAIRPALRLMDIIAVMRWLKWQMRMAMEACGRFPRWLR